MSKSWKTCSVRPEFPRMHSYSCTGYQYCTRGPAVPTSLGTDIISGSSRPLFQRNTKGITTVYCTVQGIALDKKWDRELGHAP